MNINLEEDEVTQRKPVKSLKDKRKYDRQRDRKDKKNYEYDEEDAAEYNEGD